MRYLIWLIIIAVFIAGCTTGTVEEPSDDVTSDAEVSEPDTSDATTDASTESNGLPLWMTAELKDVLTGNTFTINDFKGKPVLLESFAVWCPTCTKQQTMIRTFHRDVGDSVVSISLDTDPNEDEETVRSHAESRGFDWNFVVSPVDVTKSLIDEFGVGVVNAPSVPVIIICPDQTSKMLSGSVKGPVILKEAIKSC